MQDFILPFALPDRFKAHAEKTERIFKFHSIPEFIAGMKGVNASNSGSQSWMGGDPEVAMAQLTTGNLDRVPASDKLMTKYESLINYQSSKFINVDDICGGVPNVPAYLAGSPLTMRRRKRISSELGPLVICANLVSSAGISADKLERRNIALLSLVRALQAKRPVTLWAGGGMAASGRPYDVVATWTLLETAPMDLARVAHFLTSLPLMRGWTYEFWQRKHGGNGCWPWTSDDAEMDREVGKASLMRHMNADDVLYLPGIFQDDRSVTKPDLWIAEMIERYSKPTEID